MINVINFIEEKLVEIRKETSDLQTEFYKITTNDLKTDVEKLEILNDFNCKLYFLKGQHSSFIKILKFVQTIEAE